MSLYGALFSGVSGLNSQSSKIGIISDNIANTNTIGYKQTQAQFETLVTAQGSTAAYSPGGVLGASRQLVDRQGLLVTTDSATDIALSGAGLLVVNTGNDATGDTLYTRSGSFRQDSSGNFQNAAGYYLMAWPLDSEGRLPGEAGNLNTTPSTNLESLQVVNVKQVSGVAVSTSRVEVNANLKATQTVYPGAGATGGIDPLSTINADVAATDIIIPGAVNSIDRGDKFTVTIDDTPTTFRYGGYTFSREVSSGAVGDNNVTKLDASDTLGGTDLDVSTTLATGTVVVPATSNVVTVTVASTAGWKTGDQVTLSGFANAIDGIPIGELNGTHTITVVNSTSYTFTTTSSTGATGGNNTVDTPTQVYHPLPIATTASSNVVTIRHASHGLHTGDVVTLSGVASAVDAIPASELNDSFIITVLDDDSYTITTTTSATNAVSGGTTAVTANKRIFAGNIMDATTVSQRFLGTTGTAAFQTDSLSFSISTATVGTVSFTYTSSTPNASLGQFNTMNNLADAINQISGLNARVANGRLYISPDDANEAISFANGADEATADSNGTISYGIDWVRELDLANQASGLERFNTLQGLADLVNAVDGMSATIASPTSDASIRIFTDNPLGTIALDDPEVETAAAVTGMTIATTAGSKVITVTQNEHGYRNGDKINFTPPNGDYGGLTHTDLTGDFIITFVDSNTYTITAATAATSTDSDASLSVTIQPNKNDGSLLAELGFVASLEGGTYAAGSTGELGPEYEPTNADKNMAGGEITPQFSRPIRIYDSLGTSHDVRLAFIKTATNTWAVELYAVPATDVAAASGQIAYGTLTFNGDGSLASVSSSLSNSISINWQDGAAASSISFDWGTAGSIFGTEGASIIGKTDGVSQFDADYNVSSIDQNGATVGQLSSVQITAEGFIVANYSNGSSQSLFKIPVADFANPNQLANVSGNVFSQSASSGDVSLRSAGTNGVGTIQSSALESSNVELSEELTNMIVAQRAYQANTKIITATDQLLQELNNLIR